MNPGGGGKKAVLWFLGLVLLSGLGTGGYFLYRHLNDERNPQEQAQAGLGDPGKKSNDLKSDSLPKAGKKDEPKEGKKGEPKEVKKETSKDGKKEEPKEAKKDEPKLDAKKPVVKSDGKALVLEDAHGGEPIVAASYADGGKRLFTASKDGAVRWWHGDSLLEQDALAPAAHKEELTSLAATADGKRLALAYKTHRVELIDVDKKERAEIEPSVNPGAFRGTAVKFFAGGKRLLVLFADGRAKIWDAESRKPLCSLTGEGGGEEQSLAALDVTPDGTALVGATERNRLKWFDPTTGKEVATVKVKEDDKRDLYAVGAGQLALSPDGKSLAGVWAFDTLQFWSAEAKKSHATAKVVTTNFGGPNQLVLAPDGKLLAVTTHDGAAQLWDLVAGVRRGEVRLGAAKPGMNDPSAWVRAAAFSPDGGKLALASGASISVFDLSTVSLEKVDYAKTKDPVTSKEDEKPPVVGGGPRKETIHAAGKINRYLAAAMAPDAKAVLASRWDGTLEVYSYPDFQLKSTWKLGTTAHRIVYDPRKKLLVAASVATPETEPGVHAAFGPSELRVYDLSAVLGPSPPADNTLKPRHHQAVGASVTQMALAPDGVVVYYLEERPGGKITLARRAAVDLAGAATLELADQTDCLALARDGKTLYAGAHEGERSADTKPPHKGTLQVINVSGEKPALTKSVPLPLDPCSLEVTRDGLVIVCNGSGQSGDLLVVDPKRDDPVVARWSDMVARSRLRLSHDGHMLYIRTPSPSLLIAWPVPQDLVKAPRPEGHEIGRAGQFSTRNELLLGPDGRFLLCESGAVFELKNAGVLVAEGKKPDDGPKKQPDDPKKPDVPKQPDDPKKDEPKKPAEAGRAEALTLLSKIDPHTGAMVDLERQRLLLTLPKAGLRMYHYPDFKLLNVHKLAGTAYSPVLDRERGLLYALTPDPKRDPLGKRGGSQLLVYDVKDILDLKEKSGTDLKPVRAVTLEHPGVKLALAPGGAALFCLEMKDSKTARALKIDPLRGKVIGELPLMDYTDLMALARDGKAMYAVSYVESRALRKGAPRAVIQVIDPTEFKVTRTVSGILADPHDMEVTRGGLVFLTGATGKVAEVTVVNVNLPKPVVAVWQNVPVGACLRLSEGEGQLYLSSWKTSPAGVVSLPLPESFAESQLPQASWTAAPPAKARGEITVTPDGQYLLAESGLLFQIKEGADMPGGLPGQPPGFPKGPGGFPGKAPPGFPGQPQPGFPGGPQPGMQPGQPPAFPGQLPGKL